MAETKPKVADSLRTPKPKKKLGLSVPPALRLPHDDLIHPESETNSMPSQTSSSSPTRHTTLVAEAVSSVPVAPARDYTKVANSIHREAVPAGMFTGKSKQLYDCLYSLTRGAVVPSRAVRISRPKLMKKAGIGARVTFDTNVERLAAVGLVHIRRIAGEHDGNEYTVFLPEEVSLTSHASQTSHSSLTSHAQNLVRLDGLESSQTSHTLSVDNTNTSGTPNTSFKTNTERSDDDEAYAAFLAAMKEAVREVTGRDSSPAEAQRWKELAEVLVTELKIAAGRTTVSSAPAFFAEHLRRRLFKKDKREIEREAAAPGTGKSTALTQDQINQCPDCFGTGMWYPEGYEKGVAKCRHEKLEDVSQTR